MLWTQSPTLYEINTFPWLDELGRKYGRRLTLGEIPLREWDDLTALGIDAVWLMGVWERSPSSRRIALANPAQITEFKQSLPDFRPNDVIGSAYAVRRYVVDRRLGGREGLAAVRKILAERNVGLVLDFVPNHTALDHPWVNYHPEYYIHGSADDLREAPQDFFEANGQFFACGRDPYFPPWRDVAQVNAFSPGYRQATVETLTQLARICDGVRCDMAMLLMTEVFQQTWGSRAGDPPPQEYWKQVIPAVRTFSPDFQFIAEAYWDKEYDLQQMGFSYCYDKKLYDSLAQRSAASVYFHLTAEMEYQEKLIRFVENHDELRAAALFDAKKEKAVALAALTLPGARMIFHGQLQGYRTRVPVFLRRGPIESTDERLLNFYKDLLHTFENTQIMDGVWRLCESDPWVNPVLAWCWRTADRLAVIVINLSADPAQGLIWIPWNDFQDSAYTWVDVFTGSRLNCSGRDMNGSSVEVNMDGWNANLFLCKLS